MSYYSNVAIICKKEAYSLFMSKLSAINKTPDRILQNEEGEFALVWDQVEWFRWKNEELVKAVENAIKALNQEDIEEKPGCGYSLIRIGEDISDVEIEYNDPDIEIDMIPAKVCFDGFNGISGEKEKPAIDQGTKKQLFDYLQEISYGFEESQESLEGDDSPFWKSWSRMHEYIEKL